MFDSQELLGRLAALGCYLKNGHFKLVSGKHSDAYIQVRIGMMGRCPGWTVWPGSPTPVCRANTSPRLNGKLRAGSPPSGRVFLPLPAHSLQSDA